MRDGDSDVGEAVREGLGRVAHRPAHQPRAQDQRRTLAGLRAAPEDDPQLLQVDRAGGVVQTLGRPGDSQQRVADPNRAAQHERRLAPAGLGFQVTRERHGPATHLLDGDRAVRDPCSDTQRIGDAPTPVARLDPVHFEHPGDEHRGGFGRQRELEVAQLERGVVGGADGFRIARGRGEQGHQRGAARLERIDAQRGRPGGQAPAGAAQRDAVAVERGFERRATVAGETRLHRVAAAQRGRLRRLDRALEREACLAGRGLIQDDARVPGGVQRRGKAEPAVGPQVVDAQLAAQAVRGSVGERNLERALGLGPEARHLGLECELHRRVGQPGGSQRDDERVESALAEPQRGLLGDDPLQRESLDWPRRRRGLGAAAGVGEVLAQVAPRALEPLRGVGQRHRELRQLDARDHDLAGEERAQLRKEVEARGRRVEVALPDRDVERRETRDRPQREIELPDRDGQARQARELLLGLRPVAVDVERELQRLPHEERGGERERESPQEPASCRVRDFGGRHVSQCLAFPTCERGRGLAVRRCRYEITSNSSPVGSRNLKASHHSLGSPRRELSRLRPTRMRLHPVAPFMR